MNDDFQAIKNEFAKYADAAQGTAVAFAMYEDLARRLATYFHYLDQLNKRRFLLKLEEGEREIGTQGSYDWYGALTRFSSAAH
ncbi:hypothetical protein QP353_02275 [Klebsiella aerogenes]|uniref:hypothetical protein n=1 Tax=Klebsiella aerogenes TaxID=548 RepID=UPI00254C658E|nr:hypothetical protein [Klebsiella aerogenes]EMB4079360.1 hypothetical protein [Klebsiella aerogenes]MDK6928253.1 hypothetical protein [Klebsiella aerogenes]